MSEAVLSALVRVYQVPQRPLREGLGDLKDTLMKFSPTHQTSSTTLTTTYTSLLEDLLLSYKNLESKVLRNLDTAGKTVLTELKITLTESKQNDVSAILTKITRHYNYMLKSDHDELVRKLEIIKVTISAAISTVEDLKKKKYIARLAAALGLGVSMASLTHIMIQKNTISQRITLRSNRALLSACVGLGAVLFSFNWMYQGYRNFSTLSMDYKSSIVFDRRTAQVLASGMADHPNCDVNGLLENITKMEHWWKDRKLAIEKLEEETNKCCRVDSTQATFDEMMAKKAELELLLGLKSS